MPNAYLLVHAELKARETPTMREKNHSSARVMLGVSYGPERRALGDIYLVDAREADTGPKLRMVQKPHEPVVVGRRVVPNKSTFSHEVSATDMTAFDASNRASEGVHIVGSVRLPTEQDDALAKPPTAKDVFTVLGNSLASRLKRIPDGETGARHFFTGWQEKVFTGSPWILRRQELNHTDYDAEGEGKLRDTVATANGNENKKIELASTGYDDAAIESYNDFVQLKKDGVIPTEVRFQVCLPTPVNAYPPFVQPQYQEQVEKLYVEQLLRALHNIQKHIPPNELAIQWDCAMEFAILEGMGGWLKPWFEPSLDELVKRVRRLADAVHPDVEMGFHLCYGDLGHQHFVEPKDMGKLVEFANALGGAVERPIQWIHMPVPVGRKDDAYFAPLKELRVDEVTEIYLGLVHPNDQAGTVERIATAKKVLQKFGIGTECGWGRTAPKDVGSILEILKDGSQPVYL